MYEKFINSINEECLKRSWNDKIPEWIAKDILEYIILDPGWRYIHGEPGYIIGISEDHWDYYWMYINNKEPKLHFMTACYDVSKKCPTISKRWNKEEKKNVEKVVRQYFIDNEEHENLIYFEMV